MKKQIKLPEKLSDCIKLALKDEEKAFNSPLYKINMDVFHRKLNGDDICSVCFAGAVMAGTLEQPTVELDPCNFDEHTQNRLNALDYIRRGEISTALDFMGIPEEMHPRPYFMNVTSYESNRKGWRATMLSIANWLQAQGL